MQEEILNFQSIRVIARITSIGLENTCTTLFVSLRLFWCNITFDLNDYVYDLSKVIQVM